MCWNIVTHRRIYLHAKSPTLKAMHSWEIGFSQDTPTFLLRPKGRHQERVLWWSCRAFLFRFPYLGEGGGGRWDGGSSLHIKRSWLWDHVWKKTEMVESIENWIFLMSFHLRGLILRLYLKPFHQKCVLFWRGGLTLFTFTIVHFKLRGPF